MQKYSRWKLYMRKHVFVVEAGERRTCSSFRIHASGYLGLAHRASALRLSSHFQFRIGDSRNNSRHNPQFLEHSADMKCM